MQQIQLVQDLLAQAPPGELEYVARDLRIILSDDELFTEAAYDVFEASNERDMALARSAESNVKVMITSVGKVGCNQYFHPKSGDVMTIDHFTKTITKTRAALKRELAADKIEPFRYALEKAMRPYMHEAFPDGQCAVYGHLDDGEDGVIGATVCIASSVQRSKNFMTARWTSQWRVALRSEGEGLRLCRHAHIFGDMKAHVHYFEDGNMQLSTSYNASTEARGEDNQNLAEAVVYAIAGCEAVYLSELEDVFKDLSGRVVKDMRRALPRTGMKFPWSNQGKRLVGELRKARPQANQEEEAD